MLAAIATTQVLGWGTTFYLPSVIGSEVAAQLGLPVAVVFAGVSLMLIVGGLMSPAVARRIARRGASAVMAEGSLVFAAGLAALAASRGPLGYLAAWCLLGAAFPLALNLGAYSTIAAEFRSGTTKAMTVLGFATGLTPALAWPALAFADGLFGWRYTCAVGALLHLLVCWPLHRALRSPGRALPEAPTLVRHRSTPARSGMLFHVLGLGLVLNCFLMTGFQLHMLGLLEELGASPAEALKIGSLLGLAQVGARAVMLALARTSSAISIGVVGAGLFCAALALFALGSHGLAFLGLGVLLIGAAMGISYPTRATIPYEIFGAERFAAVFARLSMSQNIASAVAPIVVASAVAQWGARVALGLGEVVAVCSAGALAWVARRCARADDEPGVALESSRDT